MENRKEEIRELPVPLTGTELVDVGKILSRKLEDRDIVAVDKKEAMADFKSQVDHLSGEILDLTRKLSSGKELRSVVCHWDINWDEGNKVLVRDDTGEVVERQILTHEERQQRLPRFP